MCTFLVLYALEIVEENLSLELKICENDKDVIEVVELACSHHLTKKCCM